MTPSIFQTLTHEDCIRYLHEAGVTDALLQAVPANIDGSILMECATPDKFSFSTADKLFWVQIEDSEACMRIAAVLDAMIAAHPDDTAIENEAADSIVSNSSQKHQSVSAIFFIP